MLSQVGPERRLPRGPPRAGGAPAPHLEDHREAPALREPDRSWGGPPGTLRTATRAFACIIVTSLLLFERYGYRIRLILLCDSLLLLGVCFSAQGVMH